MLYDEEFIRCWRYRVGEPLTATARYATKPEQVLECGQHCSFRATHRASTTVDGYGQPKLLKSHQHTDLFGAHACICKGGGAAKNAHNMWVKSWGRCLRSAGLILDMVNDNTPARAQLDGRKEADIYARGAGDGVRWVIDVTCTSTARSSIVRRAARSAGAAARDQEAAKRRHYGAGEDGRRQSVDSALLINDLFFGVAVEMAGGRWSEGAINLLRAASKVAVQHTWSSESDFVRHWRARLSTAFQKAVAYKLKTIYDGSNINTDSAAPRDAARDV